MAAWAVDREFVHIVGPAGAPFGCLGPPLGSHWDAFGPTLVSFWSSWDTFGVHVERLGPRGLFGRPIEKQPRFGDLASVFVCKITTRSLFWALEAGATGEAEVVSKTLARTPLATHARGQDDVSLKRTPSNYV